MYDDLFPEDTGNAFKARISRPPPPPKKPFSLWGLTTAAPKGVAAGAAQGIGSTTDLIGGFGSVLGAMPASGGGMFSLPNEEEKKQQEEARNKLLTQGVDYSLGSGFRQVATDYTPDPATAHAAESAVFNLFRVGSKAITAAVTMGNVPGAVVAGFEEGFTQADELKQQGVDVSTRSGVGLVNAVVNSVGFALPVAGRTWAQTTGLALVGGPASFMAQNAATREILERADYGKQAEQYDPFDPVGLTLSTVIPFGFGALAMKARGGAPKVQPISDDLVDAARVSLLRSSVDSSNPVANDLGTVAAHSQAHAKAIDQISTGERVSVDVPEPVAIKAAEEMAKRIEPLRQELEAIKAAEPVTKAADAVEAVPAKVAAPEPFNIKALADEASRLLSDGRSVAEIVGTSKAAGNTVAPELQNMLIGASEAGRRLPELLEQFKALETQRAGAPVQDLIADAVERMRAGNKVEQPKAPANPLEARLQALSVRNPTALDATIPVEFDMDGKATRTMTAREYLDSAKADADMDVSDAKLLEVAVACAISGGS